MQLEYEIAYLPINLAFTGLMAATPGDLPKDLPGVIADEPPDDDDPHPDGDHVHLEDNVHGQSDMSDEELQMHPDMVPYMFVDTDSDADNEDLPAVMADAKRVRCLESQPEYQRLKDLGLAYRPDGCTLGCHPAARVYRAWSAGSTHFSRSFDGKSGRSAWQALLRVMELMLESYILIHHQDKLIKLAKKQLARIRSLRDAEPAHAD